jgi:hypothetical protein
VLSDIIVLNYFDDFWYGHSNDHHHHHNSISTRVVVIHWFRRSMTFSWVASLGKYSHSSDLGARKSAYITSSMYTHGSWVMGHGSWVMGHGSWVMGHGAWGMGHGAWGMGHGAWVNPYISSVRIYLHTRFIWYCWFQAEVGYWQQRSGAYLN